MTPADRRRLKHYTNDDFVRDVRFVRALRAHGKTAMILYGQVVFKMDNGMVGIVVDYDVPCPTINGYAKLPPGFNWNGEW